MVKIVVDHWCGLVRVGSSEAASQLLQARRASHRECQEKSGKGRAVPPFAEQSGGGDENLNSPTFEFAEHFLSCLLAHPTIDSGHTDTAPQSLAEQIAMLFPIAQKQNEVPLMNRLNDIGSDGLISLLITRDVSK